MSLSLWKALECILLPPFAVRDKGCGTVLLVGLLWFFFWIPGSIAAWIIEARSVEPQVVEVHHHHYRPAPPPPPAPNPVRHVSRTTRTETTEDASGQP